MAKHVLELNPDGTVNFWAHDIGYHNGPTCTVCLESWCKWCHEDEPWFDEECED